MSLHQQEFAGEAVIGGDERIKIDAAGKSAGIERDFVRTGRERAVDKLCNFTAGEVVNDQASVSCVRKFETNRRLRIERIRDVLIERDLLRKGRTYRTVGR